MNMAACSQGNSGPQVYQKKMNQGVILRLRVTLGIDFLDPVFVLAPRCRKFRPNPRD
jgi:hypothetical protein